VVRWGNTALNFTSLTLAGGCVQNTWSFTGYQARLAAAGIQVKVIGGTTAYRIPALTFAKSRVEILSRKALCS